MFRPNTTCYIQKSSGKTDVYGVPLPGVRVKERIAVIRLNIMNEKSAVRTDTSASRGNARELTADAEFLFERTTVVQIDDVVEVLGKTFRVMQVFPRQSLVGVLDHYQVVCGYWSA